MSYRTRLNPAYTCVAMLHKWGNTPHPNTNMRQNDTALELLPFVTSTEKAVRLLHPQSNEVGLDKSAAVNRATQEKQQ